MKSIQSTVIFTFAWLWLLIAPGHAAGVDHSLFAALLDRHVDQGVVDYQSFQKDEADLDRYLEMLAAVDPAGLSKNERFAFYTNAYNAWTIKLILSRYPDIRSIKDFGGLFSSPWKKKIARIDGKVLTLDYIEHEILRKQFKDPRVHFAVNCASKGCPPLQGEPFTGERLDEQLNRAAVQFINTPRFNRLEGDILWVSRIFDWFGEDFDQDVLGTFIRYAEPQFKSELERNRARIKIRHLDYDWSLNGT